MTASLDGPALARQMREYERRIRDLERALSRRPTDAPVRKASLPKREYAYIYGSRTVPGDGLDYRVTLTSVWRDTGGFYKSTQPSRLTATKRGLYCIEGGGSWADTANAGSISMSIRINDGVDGDSLIALDSKPRYVATGWSAGAHNLSVEYDLNVGDFVVLKASTRTTSLGLSGNLISYLALTYLGPLV